MKADSICDNCVEVNCDLCGHEVCSKIIKLQLERIGFLFCSSPFSDKWLASNLLAIETVCFWAVHSLVGFFSRSNLSPS